ncbi:putative beta-alanine synthase [Plectosphaerella plurivora]|uniref:Beta-alanine synthase n=1 Tax=Plectosphaerella plurivora TaxID=936078 RepID=A0A9P8UYK3_9PEZI|nr:putative beta-alanine synthase [Plectosphaerella plurivora]
MKMKSPLPLRHIRGLATTSSPRLSGLTINADRLNETLHETCKWGAANRYGDAPTQTGMSRLSLSDDDARVRRWFAEETTSLGCSVTLDQMGNQFIRQTGSLASPLPMTAMGSHLDTQPRGGRYDGILGIMAALEVLRTMRDAGFKTQLDLGIVNWTNEEGARFPKSMVSSGVWAGDIPLQKAWSLADIFDPSATMESELRRHDLIGDIACSSDGFPLGAHFELHIEQGPILPANNARIGVVRGAQAYRWLTISLAGRDAHTGTTPLEMRSDPLLAAAKMISASNAVAKRHGALASTGVLKMPPSSSTNTIASNISFTLDIRHPEDAVVDTVQAECLAAFEALAKEDGRGVGFSWTLDTDSPATKFDDECIAAVENAADALVGPEGWLHITSGAGHDSVYTSRRCPTTMIFVPCKDGVSHHPEEYCSPEDW